MSNYYGELTFQWVFDGTISVADFLAEPMYVYEIQPSGIVEKDFGPIGIKLDK